MCEKWSASQCHLDNWVTDSVDSVYKTKSIVRMATELSSCVKVEVDPNKPKVSVDVKQHFNHNGQSEWVTFKHVGSWERTKLDNVNITYKFV